nr:hypothetical protein [Bradyrhizobium barranii]
MERHYQERHRHAQLFWRQHLYRSYDDQCRHAKGRCGEHIQRYERDDNQHRRHARSRFAGTNDQYRFAIGRHVGQRRVDRRSDLKRRHAEQPRRRHDADGE